MTPGTLVLLGSGLLADALRTYGLHVVIPHPSDAPTTGPRYVAGASLAIGAAAPVPPLVLIAHGDCGPLLPAIASAQRAAHRTVGAYIFVDTDLPTPAGDWPDAPCAYLSTTPGDPRLRAAELRAWTTAEAKSDDLPHALRTLIADL